MSSAKVHRSGSMIVQFDGALNDFVNKAIKRAAPLTVAAMVDAVESLVEEIKGPPPSGPSWAKTNRYDKISRVWREGEGPTGSRTAKQWPVKSGRSRAGFRTYTRLKPPDRFEAVITNDATAGGARYPFMIRALHLPTRATAMNYLVKRPLAKAAKQIAEDLAHEIADKIDD